MVFLKFAETSKNIIIMVSFAPEGRKKLGAFRPISKSPLVLGVGEQGGGALRPNTTDSCFFFGRKKV